ncbi:MAG: hypothetical protein V4773_28570, partial [Verrucomicrobiota bacterium]
MSASALGRSPFRSPFCSTFSALVALFLALPGARAAEYDHHLKATPETVVFGYYSAATKPVLTIKSGERVKVDTISLSGIPDDP